MQKAKFITLEGMEGVGKSTNMSFIADYLRQQKLTLCVTREPGGTEIAEAIRQLLLQQYQETMVAECELLLLFAGRTQHVKQKILPALHQGQWVLCDRYVDASFAYQAGGRGIEVPHLNYLEDWLLGEARPDLTLLLDAPVALALQRARERSGSPDRFEVEDHDFFERIRTAYLERATQHPERFRIIDASVDIAKVQQQIKHHLDEFMATQS